MAETVSFVELQIKFHETNRPLEKHALKLSCSLIVLVTLLYYSFLKITIPQYENHWLQ